MLLKLLLLLLILAGCSVVVRRFRKRRGRAIVAPADAPFSPPPWYRCLVPPVLRFLVPYQERCAGFRVLPDADPSWIPAASAYIRLIDMARREQGASVVIPSGCISLVLAHYQQAIQDGQMALDEEALIGDGLPARLIVYAYPCR